MKILDLFSGIGGFAYAFHLAGVPHRIAAFCEIEPFPRAVLRKHWPEVPIHEDIRQLTTDALPGIDCIVGGFPCQDISVAGNGAGIDGARSGLWREMCRLIRECRPAWVIAENVPALRTRGYDRVADDLEALGYSVRPLVVGAEHVGAPHRRHRVWIVANAARGGRGEGAGLWRDGEPRRRGQPAGSDQAMADTARHVPQGPDKQRTNRQRVGESGDGPLADAELAGLEGHRPDAWQPQVAELGDRRPRWPARPGEPQHEWEAPRLAELGVGGATDGVSARLVRRHNRDALKAYGNSIVPQVAAAVIRSIFHPARSGGEGE